MDTGILNQVVLENTVQSYLLFLGIIFFGLLFKRLLSKLLSKGLFKVFTRIHANTDAGIFTSLLMKPVEFLLLLLIFYTALNQLSFPLNQVIFRRISETNNVKQIYELKLIQALDHLFLFALIIGIFWVLLRIVDFLAYIFSYKAAKTTSRSDDQLVPFVRDLAKIITVILAVFVIMGSVFKLNVATIVAGLGIGGIAIALAAQDTLQNLLGSFAIFADKPFHVGDHIKIENIEGNVERVGFRSTHIRTLEKTVVIIPNKKMIDTPLENFSMRDFFRVRFDLALDTNTSNEQMHLISKEIREFINSNDSISKDTIVYFESFGTATVNIQVTYFIRANEGLDIVKLKEAIYYRVRQIVTENNASFATPSPFNLQGPV